MFPLEVTSFLGRARNKVLWQDLVLKHNIELWPLLLMNLFGLKQLLKELQFGDVTQMTFICDN